MRPASHGGEEKRFKRRKAVELLSYGAPPTLASLASTIA